MALVPHLSIRGMYRMEIYYFSWATPIKGILSTIILGVN
jgi:hypothetical protein